ncbi:cell surface protein [Methanosarcina barkeri 3]|uniref:Cell surface protein n=1 Tax=Methanosarcina barkeri 3 TaxID=1434107 RepID=A0A0E3WWK7_METBA|nr:PKD domain-containing protein [Methanosarcina barkeri]AKB82085.1 cell surface protein [Methanosarcina barkeri 3]
MTTIIKSMTKNRAQNKAQNRVQDIAKHGLVLSIFLILLFAFVGSASAQTIEVNPSDDVRSILLNEAQAGDVIYFNPGTYQMTRNWAINDKPVSLIGSGADKVTVLGKTTSINYGDYESASDIRVENISFSNGFSIYGSDYGDSNVVIENCVMSSVSLGNLKNVEVSNNVFISPYAYDVQNSISAERLTFIGNRMDKVGWNMMRVSGNITGNTFANTSSIPTCWIGECNNYLTLKDNVFSNCTLGAILISGDSKNSKNNIITENTFDSNSEGINVGTEGNGIPGAGNKIYLNNFINNTVNINDGSPAGSVQYISNAVKYSYKNESYTSSLGNYYNDYTGADADNNGIGDTPYAIGSGSDTAPLMGKITVDGNDIIIEALPSTSSPIADFTATPTSGDAPLTVNFTDTSTGNVSSYSWDFNNDGIIDSTEQNPVYTYIDAGNYTVNLTVTNAIGINSTVKTDYITVSENSTPSEPPISAFLADVTNGTAPLTVKFTDQSTGNISSYSWDFDNDGIIDSTEQSPSYTYGTAGTYTVNLTVSNADGSDSEVKTGYIKVTVSSPGKPVAAFSASSASGKTPLTVAFTDKSSNMPTKWKWSFGDGASSTIQNPKHKYSKAGKYTVTLTVANAKGSNTITETDYIKVISKPDANFTSSVTSGKAPLNVKFTDTSTGMASGWIWEFGDGSKSFVENPTHKYSKAGTYTVNLTVKNAAGSNKVTKTEYIKVTAKPVSNFTSSVTSGKAPLNVKFTDTSTGTPAAWIWEFGDGSKSFVEHPTHKYSKAGTYTVKLTVKNAVGSNTVTKTDYIKVTAKPVANFTSSVTSGKSPLTVAFTDTSTGSPSKWKWNFGDGASSTLQNPKHKYSKAGNYTVTLTATNAAGSSTTTKTNYMKVTAV